MFDCRRAACLLALAAMLFVVPPADAIQTAPPERPLLDRLSADPTDVVAMIDLALVYLGEDRSGEALAMVRRAQRAAGERVARSEARPTAPPGDDLVARLEALADLMRDQPGDPQPVLERARLFYAAGDPGQALDMLTSAEKSLAASPTEPVRLGRGITAPRKTHDERPRYPKIAQDARLEGLVIIEAVIDREGRVRAVKLLRSIEEAVRAQGLDQSLRPAAAAMDDAALEAVRRWRYTPTVIDGKPIAVIMTVTVNFSVR